MYTTWRRPKYIIIATLLFGIGIGTGCAKDPEEEIKQRDKILAQAFKDLKSNNDKTVIKGIRTIKKNQTHDGMHRLIALWETDVTPGIEKEILAALRDFEVFTMDDDLVKEIFYQHYKKGMAGAKKDKLKRLINATDSEIKYELIKKLETN